MLLETNMTPDNTLSADSSAYDDTEKALLARVKRAAPEALNKLLLDPNWQTVPLPVMEWVASRQGVCLTAALHGFFNADPMRFNYLHKREVPSEFRALCRFLDALFLRINSGFYDNSEHCKGAVRPTGFDNWLACQALDAADGQQGRWVFQESVFHAKLTSWNNSPPFVELAEAQALEARQGDWRGELKQAVQKRFGGFVGTLNQA